MIILGKDIQVYRGEQWALDRYVVMSNGNPYILFNDRKNQYLQVLLSSNAYRTQGRYHMIYWLDLATYPKFKTREPVFLVNGLAGGLPAGMAYNDAIFYIVDTAGKKEFYYWPSAVATAFLPYSFRFVKTFIPTDTELWIEQQYGYAVRIVSGESTYEFLVNIFIALYPGVQAPSDTKAVYMAICKKDPDLVKNVNYKAPLINFDNIEVISNPAKIIVKVN